MLINKEKTKKIAMYSMAVTWTTVRYIFIIIQFNQISLAEPQSQPSKNSSASAVAQQHQAPSSYLYIY